MEKNNESKSYNSRRNFNNALISAIIDMIEEGLIGCEPDEGYNYGDNYLY